MQRKQFHIIYNMECRVFKYLKTQVIIVIDTNFEKDKISLLN